MKNKNLTVGLFVLAGLALFTVGLFVIGNRHEAFARHIDYYAEFTYLAGLSKGSKVQVAGMDAGQVLEIGVPESPSSRFRVRLRIDDRLHGLVRTDSVATIETQGVVGDTFLLIHPGSPRASAAAALATLSSKEPLDIADLLDQGKGVLGDVDGTVKDADAMMKKIGGQLDTTLSGVTTTVSNANDVVVGLKDGRGAAGMFLQDQALAAQIRQSVANAQQATDNLNHASSQADGLISDIQSRHFPQTVDETMANIKSAASNLDASAQQIHQTIAEVAGPDERGETAGLNIRESLSNANAATANMADETEALKHSFFFRGFFRHRGYYNLMHISPDKYRKDRLVTDPTNYRAWLPSAELFERESDGDEELSARGRALLDNALAQYGDSVVESPIVIEGYSEEGSNASRLATSRRRAILVRKYLQNHFQLDPGNLGAVPMTDLPPAGVGHPSWDGVCIVVSKRRL
jgi:phospholipid/cholesterol/gamma-HCH transport system substrate-binding protein